MKIKLKNMKKSNHTEKSAGILAVLIISLVILFSIIFTGCDDNIETTTTLELVPYGYASSVDWDVDNWNARYNGNATINETETTDFVMWCMIEGPYLPIGLPTIVYVDGSSPYYTTINGYDVMIIAPN
tara:strand:+ start:57 stop:440 length:384 start_codon:yes stop_codon:yes gene_type:complete